MSLSGRTGLLGSGGTHPDQALNPKSRGATLVAPGVVSLLDSTDVGPEGSAVSVASTTDRAFRTYGVVTARKEAIPPQPDDALA
jgi:hypothetical protein